jgi:TonB family protein
MGEAPGSLLMAQTELPAPELILLIAPEPRFRVFLQNLLALFRQPEFAPPPADSSPAAFWPDVFVDRGLPWLRFLQSGVYHVLALALIWAGSRFLALQPHPTTQASFTHADVIYYAPAEYLPPLDTRRSTSAHTRKADPEYSVQPIISVPPEADNRSQTIVTPPNIRLQRDVAFPNVVSLLERIPSNPRMPIGPAPALPASEISRLAPRMERAVIAPPPDLQAASQKTLPAPQAAVIAPPPAVEAGSTRRLGDLNIGHSAVIAAAPQLSLDEQHAMTGRSSTALRSPQGRSPQGGSPEGSSPQVIAPPPSLAASARSRSDRSMIALNLHPAVGAPPDPPAGNRRGNFAATPEGHRRASGAPGASAGNGTANSNGSGKSSGNLPSGLYVGKPSNTISTVAGDPATKNSESYFVNPNLIAGMRPPRMPSRTSPPESESKLSDEERTVFGNRKFYSLSLNMPNLNSAGGSWIIRFAALKPDSSTGSPSSRAAVGDQSADGPSSTGPSSTGPSPAGPSPAGPSSADLSAPVATRKVDPAYPLELMRQNVSGTVILYGVIHTDGRVGSVRVLRSVDDRLDRFARDAIVKWQFQPATKNGSPVDVEATFWIPFHPAKVESNF